MAYESAVSGKRANQINHNCHRSVKPICSDDSNLLIERVRLPAGRGLVAQRSCRQAGHLIRKNDGCGTQLHGKIRAICNQFVREFSCTFPFFFLVTRQSPLTDGCATSEWKAAGTDVASNLKGKKTFSSSSFARKLVESAARCHQFDTEEGGPNKSMNKTKRKWATKQTREK